MSQAFIAAPAVVLSRRTFLAGGASLADPPNTLNNIGRHQHFLITPNGDPVPIGPDFCDNPDLQDAFNQFHYNIHHNSGAPTNGPQDGAPGLHNDVGAEMVPGPCD